MLKALAAEAKMTPEQFRKRYEPVVREASVHDFEHRARPVVLST